MNNPSLIMDTTTKKVVLIVEDEKPLARALQLKLTAEGFSILLALDGEEGLQQIKEHEVDLVLLDLVMPKMDGFAFLTALKELGKKIPVIVASNLGQEQDVERAKVLGVKDYYIKSNISLAEIVTHIKKYI